ncbi:MAG TPA: hypothetical protein PLU22_21980 [Polyangiaceae bacterium]|nr:hypothetical protein [Polyangiaceae bacterium]
MLPRPSALRIPSPAARLAVLLLTAAGAVGAQEPAEREGDEAEAAPPAEVAPPSAVAELARVEDLYRATRFRDCVDEARRLLVPGNPEGVQRPTEIDRARTYLAACLVRSGDAAGGEGEFDRAIRAALAENRAFPRPNSLVFSAEVVERYDAARRRLEGELEARRRATLEAAEDQRAAREQEREAERDRQRRLLELAEQESVVVQNRRWVAAVPFGVGQFQNRRPALGYVFLVSELLALGVVVGGISAEISLASYASEHASSLDREERADVNLASQRVRDVWVAGFYSLAGLAALGIADAELRFVPEFRTVRTRPVPEELRPPTAEPSGPRTHAPRLTGAPGGLGLGLAVPF